MNIRACISRSAVPKAADLLITRQWRGKLVGVKKETCLKMLQPHYGTTAHRLPVCNVCGTDNQVILCVIYTDDQAISTPIKAHHKAIIVHKTYPLEHSSP